MDVRCSSFGAPGNRQNYGPVATQSLKGLNHKNAADLALKSLGEKLRRPYGVCVVAVPSLRDSEIFFHFTQHSASGSVLG